MVIQNSSLDLAPPNKNFWFCPWVPLYATTHFEDKPSDIQVGTGILTLPVKRVTYHTQILCLIVTVETVNDSMLYILYLCCMPLVIVSTKLFYEDTVLTYLLLFKI